jgi:hypothetical protein
VLSQATTGTSIRISTGPSISIKITMTDPSRRAELSPAGEALHSEARNEENQHTRVRKVGEGSPAERFTADTASKTGHSECSIQRDATRGERIAPDVLRVVASAVFDGRASVRARCCGGCDGVPRSAEAKLSK